MLCVTCADDLVRADEVNGVTGSHADVCAANGLHNAANSDGALHRSGVKQPDNHEVARLGLSFHRFARLAACKSIRSAKQRDAM